MEYTQIYSRIKEDNPTRSEIFSAFNKIKAIGRRGLWDMGRMNRALGLIISQAIRGEREEAEDYVTTKTGCTCPDCHYRKVVCKHMISLYILDKIEESRQTEREETAEEIISRNISELGF